MCRRRSLFIFSLVLSVIFSISSTLAQQQPSPYTPPPNPSVGGNLTNAFGRTSYEFWLTCLICFVGIIIIVLLIYSITRYTEAKPEDISRPVIVVTVIVSALILVTAGYSNEQIAPAFGLFGTIVGYILGRLSSSGSPPRSSTSTPTTG